MQRKINNQPKDRGPITMLTKEYQYLIKIQRFKIRVLISIRQELRKNSPSLVIILGQGTIYVNILPQLRFLCRGLKYFSPYTRYTRVRVSAKRSYFMLSGFVSISDLFYDLVTHRTKVFRHHHFRSNFRPVLTKILETKDFQANKNSSSL